MAARGSSQMKKLEQDTEDDVQDTSEKGAARKTSPGPGVRNTHRRSSSLPRPAPLTDDPMRNQVIMDYAPLIKFIAQRIAARLPANVDIDDLCSAGVIGLMDAIDKYDPSRDNKFKTYAEFRIRGAILDELRNQDWLPRSVRDLGKKEDRARMDLERQLGRPPTDKEVADYLELTLEAFYERSGRTRVAMLSLEDLGGVTIGDKRSILESLENPNAENPFTYLKNKGVRELLMKTIEDLPEKLKLVLSLYYYEDLNLREIGRILDVTESRVSQLHTQAVQKVRHRLRNLLMD